MTDLQSLPETIQDFIMKQFFTTLSFTLFVFSSSFASTIFVQAGQNGTGTSWDDAMGNLQEALDMALAGTEILGRSRYLLSFRLQAMYFKRPRTIF